MGRRKPPGLKKRGGVWWIDKQIDGCRLVESCKTDDLAEAERLLSYRLEQLRLSNIYGHRPTRTLGQAVEKYLTENQHKRSIDRDAYAVIAVFRHLDPDQRLDRVHDGTPMLGNEANSPPLQVLTEAVKNGRAAGKIDDYLIRRR